MCCNAKLWGTSDFTANEKHSLQQTISNFIPYRQSKGYDQHSKGGDDKRKDWQTEDRQDILNSIYAGKWQPICNQNKQKGGDVWCNGDNWKK